MTAVLIEEWPGGVTTIAGGTRVQIKLARPWQMHGPNIDSANCPFEPASLEKRGESIISRSNDGKWMSLTNLFTPYDNHVLVVPTTCADWPEEKVRLLGGEAEITTALELIYHLVTREAAFGKTAVVTVNIGQLAGQNIGHHHWHVFNLPPDANRMDPNEVARQLQAKQKPRTLIASDANFSIYAGGHRSGQCFILPHGGKSAGSLARALAQLVALYANKFRGTTGEKLAPDFTIGLIFSQGAFQYGTYVPVLNNWGSTEYLAILGQQPATLPWPHYLTAAYLRGEIDP